MNSNESPAFDHDQYYGGGNCDVTGFVIRVKRGDPQANEVAPSDDLRNLRIGLRILDCFSARHQTLTTEEITEILDESEEEVAQWAAVLTGLGYLRANWSSGAAAWMRIG